MRAVSSMFLPLVECSVTARASAEKATFKNWGNNTYCCSHKGVVLAMVGEVGVKTTMNR